MIDEYVIGDPITQEWVIKGLSAYRKLDGSVGYEFENGRVYYRLNKGEKLVNTNGKVRRIKGEEI